MKIAPEPTVQLSRLSPDPGYKCSHGSVEHGRICGECAAKIRAKGFQEGYAKGLADGTPKMVDHSPKQKTWSGVWR